MSPAKKILIADDDFDILEQISALMQSEEYEVIAVGSQQEAEDALLTEIPALAIIDLMMENMDSGFVLSHQIKKLYPEVPVIILTAVASNTGMSFNRKSQDLHNWVKADVLLDKPVRPEQLKGEVRRLLNR